MYQLLNNPYGGEPNCVLRIVDRACIPFAEANADYQEYQRWLESGNVPLAAEDNEPLPADEAVS